MAEQWPLTLQEKFNAQGFSVQVGDTKIESENETGPPLVRSRNTLSIDEYSTSIDVNKTELATFQSFYKTTLANGTKRFEFTDPLTDTVEEFQFVGSYGITPIGSGGIEFRISYQLRKLT